VESKVKLDHSKSKIISKIYELAEVTKTVYEDNYVLLNYRASSINNNQIKKLIENN
jgi:hypothetical protein